MQEKPIPISVCILTKNCEAKIDRCLAPLAPFDEVLILDTGSTDRTLEIAGSFPHVRILHQDGLDHFGATRNYLSSEAKHDWVLHVDSDEYLSEEFVRNLARTDLAPNTVYSIRRRFYYRGRPITSYDEWILRLYNRRETNWKMLAVHESIELQPGMKSVRLPEIVEHHSYDNISQLIQKADRYSSLAAEELAQRKKVSAPGALLRGGFALFKHYFVKRGFLHGYDGMAVSCGFALATFLKYAKAKEFQDERPEKINETINSDNFDKQHD